MTAGTNNAHKLAKQYIAISWIFMVILTALPSSTYAQETVPLDDAAPAPPLPPTVSKDLYMLGDWGGLRHKLADHDVTWSFGRSGSFILCPDQRSDSPFARS